MSIPLELLEILACPKCKKEIKLNNDKKTIVCEHCKLLYKIENNIPIMLIEESETFE